MNRSCHEEKQMATTSAKAPLFHIRNMTRKDTPQVLTVWSQHGLDEAVETVETFLTLDPGAFFVAEIDDSDEIIGFCAAPRINPANENGSHFLGLYGVKKGYQGLGIGTKVWRLVMDYIGDRNCGLHAVPEHFIMYRDKAGFKVEEGRSMAVHNGIADLSELNEEAEGITIAEAEDTIREKVISYDVEIHFQNRQHLLNLLFKQQNLLALAALDSNNSIIGYGCCRLSYTGDIMMGPVYGDNARVAEVLINHLLTRSNKKFCKTPHENGAENGEVSGRSVLCMSLASNPNAVSIFKKIKLPVHEETPRLWTKFITKADYQRIYCVLSPNFSL